MQPFGPSFNCIVTSLLVTVHAPDIAGHPAPVSVKVPAGSNCSVKSRITSGADGSDGWVETADRRAVTTRRATMIVNSIAYGAYFTLDRNASNVLSAAATVFAGPVSLMKYGPFEVSITAARSRKFGLLCRSLAPGVISAT